MNPPAALSLDLDNAWSYLRTRGDPGWASAPSLLPVVVPRMLELLDRRGWKITFFIVGRDAAHGPDRPWLRAIAEAGHEIGNHSFHHEAWRLHEDGEAVGREIAEAEAAIAEATGRVPRGYRAPGYSWSSHHLRALLQRGYRYDASLLPSCIGPLARAWYFLRTGLRGEARAARRTLFGRASDACWPLRPFHWRDGEKTILEFPTGVSPWLRLPVHASYLLYLSRFSPRAARWHLERALRWHAAHGLPFSFLLHPLDLLERAEAPALAFFPGMDMPLAVKRQRLEGYLDQLAAHFTPLPLETLAARLPTTPGRDREIPA